MASRTVLGEHTHPTDRPHWTAPSSFRRCLSPQTYGKTRYGGGLVTVLTAVDLASIRRYLLVQQ